MYVYTYKYIQYIQIYSVCVYVYENKLKTLLTMNVYSFGQASISPCLTHDLSRYHTLPNSMEVD